MADLPVINGPEVWAEEAKESDRSTSVSEIARLKEMLDQSDLVVIPKLQHRIAELEDALRDSIDALSHALLLCKTVSEDSGDRDFEHDSDAEAETYRNTVARHNGAVKVLEVNLPNREASDGDTVNGQPATRYAQQPAS